MAKARRKKAMSGQFTVTVEGLDDLRKAFRVNALTGDRDWLKALNQDIANDVIDTAKGKASAPRERSIAGRLKARKQEAKSIIHLGGRGDALGAEFGGGRGRRTHQFRPWLGRSDGAGYFLFPAIRAEREQVAERYRTEIDKKLAELAAAGVNV
jgi:hypothetical protein